MQRFAYLAFAIGMILASSATAQTNPQATPVPSTEATDLNRIECRRVEQIGTRLGTKKVCLTVQQWMSRARDDRDQLEKGQSDTRARRSG